jgi:hypothetical protein
MPLSGPQPQLPFLVAVVWGKPQSLPTTGLTHNSIAQGQLKFLSPRPMALSPSLSAFRGPRQLEPTVI